MTGAHMDRAVDLEQGRLCSPRRRRHAPPVSHNAQAMRRARDSMRTASVEQLKRSGKQTEGEEMRDAAGKTKKKKKKRKASH